MAFSDEPGTTPPAGDSPKPSADDKELYGVAESEEPSAESGEAASPGGESAEWYVGLPDGQREGPLSRSEMKRRLAAGDLTRADLVWRQGMAGWAAAGTVPELFETAVPGPGPGAPPPPRPAAGQTAAGLGIASADMMRRFDTIFERPIFFRVFGRICAVLGVFVLFIAIIVALTAKRDLFLYVFWFALLFLVGEAAAAILGRLDRPRDGGGCA